MAFQLEDGTGTGNRATVNSENRLLTTAINHELQHHMSFYDGQVYQVIGDHNLTSSGTKPILHITNTDPDKDLTVSYMRVQYPDSTSVIDMDTYFQLGFGREYVSNGSIVTPVNMNASSGNDAIVECHSSNPVLSGSFNELDRWYCDKSMMTFNKHGSLVLGLGNSMEWRLVTNQTSGLAYVRVTMMMMNKPV